MVPVAGWKETQVSDMDFDTIMEKAYEEYFEGLAEGEEAYQPTPPHRTPGNTSSYQAVVRG